MSNTKPGKLQTMNFSKSEQVINRVVDGGLHLLSLWGYFWLKLISNAFARKVTKNTMNAFCDEISSTRFTGL